MSKRQTFKSSNWNTTEENFRRHEGGNEMRGEKSLERSKPLSETQSNK
jgi:hypothetical protein